MASKEALKWKILDLERENNLLRALVDKPHDQNCNESCENLNLQRHFDALASSHRKMQKKLAGISEILHLDNL